MKIHLVIVLFAFTQFACGQRMNNERFFTWDEFIENFGREMVSAEDVYNSMKNKGLHENSITKFDFTFASDKKKNLDSLATFLKEHYPYTITNIEKDDELWELNGETGEFPVTADNLLFWALDMYKRGYEFDSKLEAYGAPFDPKNPEFPDLAKTKESYYFDKGVDCYNSGDLSGAIINWSNVLVINPQNQDAYYSRAIVKNELHTWKAALKDYDKALEIAPDFISALTNRGSLKDENGDYHGAIEDYNKVISLKDVDLENRQMAYFNRGNSKLNLKDKKGACEDWHKALELGADYASERINQHCK